MKYLNQMLEYNKQNNIRINSDIRKTIQKQIRIHQKYIYRPDRVEQYIDFIESNFFITSGELRPIRLMPTQKFWVELFQGYDTILPTGEQVNLVNEVFMVVGRGTGKSTLLASLCLSWQVLGGNYGGKGSVVSYDHSLADIIFNNIANQAKTSPLFVEMAESNLFKSTKKGLVFTPMNTTFSKITNDENRLQGNAQNFVVADELHLYKYNTLEPIIKGQRLKQKQWQNIAITSGGTTRGGLFDDYMKRYTSEEEFQNDRSVALIYRLEDKKQIKDEKNWGMAMPLIGELPTWDSMRTEYNLSKQDPVKQVKLLSMSFGLQMNDTVYYYQPDEAKKSEFDLSVFEKQKVWVGIDLSLSDDLTSVSFMCKPEDGNTYVHTVNFTTRDNFESVDKGQQELYTKFEAEGSLVILESDYIRSSDIIPYMNDFKNKTHCIFKKVGYDPARYEILHNLIEKYFFDKDGDKQVPIRQGWHLSDFAKILKRTAEQGKFKHHQDLVEWSLMNMAVKIGNSGDLFMRKKTNDQKIDTAVSITMALEAMISDDM